MKRKKREEEEEHVISEREKRAWAAGKQRSTRRERPKLDRIQRIEFLKLVASMAPAVTFERTLGLEPRDIDFYKKELDIESQDEARRLARRLRGESQETIETRIIAETKKAREAEAVANKRLDAIEAKKAVDAAKPGRKVDVNKVKQEDAERQRRFAAQQSHLEEPTTKWRLPMEEGAGSKAEQIDRFRRDLIYHGVRAVQRNYGRHLTLTQLKWEAARLGLRINWEIVRK